MKKNILVFGLIAGLILTANMIYMTIRCYTDPDGLKGNAVLGYAAMILVFSLIFVGVRNYREKYNNGVITFGRAFRMGFLIALVASTMYMLVWLVEYYLFVPDFLDKYIPHVLQEAREKGASAAEMEKKVAEMENFRQLYRNPLMVVLITYSEVLPVGVLVALISALILKRRERKPRVAHIS